MRINRFKEKLSKILKKDLDNEEVNLAEKEIISIINEGQEKGIIEAYEAEMIANIIEFNEKEVRDIMKHRKKIVAINCNLTVEEALNFMLDKSFSRFPLYEDNIDNIVGILHLKDVTKYYISNKKDVPLKEIAREPYFVPNTQNIDILFKDMQDKKIHMAIAIDEYGQTAGIVAMEDILEEIVGNILDEYDVDEKFIIDKGDGTYLMKGLTKLEDVSQALDLELESNEFDTLNGLLISLIGHIPNEGERLKIKYSGYIFHILDVRNKIIRFVKVTKDIEKIS